MKIHQEMVDIEALPAALSKLLKRQDVALELYRAENERQEAELKHYRVRSEQQEAELERQKAENEELQDACRRLENLLIEMKHCRFGRKSERLDPDEFGQMSLFGEDIETAISEAEEALEKAKGTSGKRKKTPKGGKADPKRNIGNLPKDVPHIEEIVEPDSTVCSCGCDMVKVGEDVNKRLDIVPAQVRVIVTKRPKYVCNACKNKFIQAPVPAHIVKGGMPTEGALAQILVAKFADHLPLYRQSRIYTRSGINLDRSTLANWVGKASFALIVVVNHLVRNLKQSRHLFMDETRAPVLDPGRGRTKTGYLWGLARDQRSWGGPEPPAVAFFYAPGRGGCYAEEFLKGFKGKLHVDGYAAYNAVATPGTGVVLCYCWSHARRKLYEAYKSLKSPIAAEGLEQIKEMYGIEADIRGKSAEFRLAERQVRTAPLVDDFGVWLNQKRAQVSPRSSLGGKLAYIANHWDGLQVFLTDGRVEMDNNTIENANRMVALNRKNALFAGHDQGAENWGRMATLIGTARMNGVDPFAYLKYTLEAIAAGHPLSDMDALMPWAFKDKFD